MAKSFRQTLNQAAKKADTERKEYLQKLEDESRARWNALEGYRTLEENFGLPLQAILNAERKTKNVISMSIKVSGKTEQPAIEMEVSRFQGKGNISITLLDNGNVTMDINKGYYGTNLTDKIETQVKPLGSEMTLDEAQQALAVFIANQDKKYRKIAQNTVSWGRFMKQSLVPVWNEEYKCANELVGLKDKPKPSLLSFKRK